MTSSKGVQVQMQKVEFKLTSSSFFNTIAHQQRTKYAAMVAVTTTSCTNCSLIVSILPARILPSLAERNPRVYTHYFNQFLSERTTE